MRWVCRTLVAAAALASGGCAYYRYDSAGTVAGSGAVPAVLTLNRDLATTGTTFPVFGLPAFTSASELTSEMATPGEPIRTGTVLDVEQAGRLTTREILSPCYGGDGQSAGVLLARVRDGSHRGEHLLLRTLPSGWFKDVPSTQGWELPR